MSMIVGKQAMRVALGVSLASSLFACAHHGHHAHAHQARGTIAVTGVGEAHGAPDVARTSIGVETRAAGVQEALQQANAQIAHIIAALKEQGIAESDLRTHGFSVSYDREYVPSPVSYPAVVPEAAAPVRSARSKGEAPAKGPEQSKAGSAEVASTAAEPAPPSQPTRGSYVVNNQLEVTVREVGKLGAVLNAATAAGANNIWGINFDLADKRPLLEKARAEAIDHAKSDAERVASLSGVKLGKVIHVSDGVQTNAVPMGLLREKAQASNAVPVQEGELTISHQVSVEYAIADAP